MAQKDLRVELGIPGNSYASALLKVKTVPNGSPTDPKSRVTATLYGEIHQNLPNYNVGSRSETTITIDGRKYSTPASSWIYKGRGLYKLAEVVADVSHDNNGDKTLSISFYYPIMATTQGVYKGSASASTTLTLENIPTWGATKPARNLKWSASKKVGDYVLPTEPLTFSWTAATAGFSNAISRHDIEIWRSDTKTTTTIQKTTTSHSYTQPGDVTRGAYYQFRIKTTAAQDIQYSEWSGRIYTTKTPKTPIVTLDAARTVADAKTTTSIVSAAGGVTSTGVNDVYYGGATGDPIDKITSGQSFPLNIVGDNIIRFWTWDGLEFSAASAKTITRVPQPTISNFEVTKIGNHVDSTHSNANYPAALQAQFTLTTNGLGQIEYEVLRGDSTSTIATSAQKKVITIPSSAVSVVVNLSEGISNPFSQYVKIRVKYINDYGDETSWSTQTYGFFLGKEKTPVNFYNTLLSSNKEGANPDHFFKELNITHSSNTMVSNSLYYSISESGDKFELNGQVTQLTTSTNIKEISNAQTPGQKYYFFLRSIHKGNGAIKDVLIGSKTQVPKWEFQNVVVPTTINPVAGAGISQEISFVDNTGSKTNGLIDDYSIAGLQNFTVSVQMGDRSFDIGHAAQKNASTLNVARNNEVFYPWSFDKSDKETDLNHNLFSLEYGKTHQLSFEICVQNAFGQEFKTSRNFDLELIRQFFLESGYSNNYKLESSIGALSRSIPGLSSGTLQVYDNEYVTAIAQLPQVQKGHLYYYQFRLKTDNGSFIPYGARRPALGMGSTLQVIRSEPFLIKEEPAEKNYEFDIVFYGNPENNLSQAYVAKIKHPRFISNEVSLRGAEPLTFASTTIKIDYSTQSDLGVDSLDTLDRVDLILEKTTKDATEPIKQKIVTLTTLSGIGGEKSYTFTGVGSMVAEDEEIAQYRFGIIRYPKRIPSTGGDDWGGEKIAWSDYFRTYPSVPAQRWRENYLGINSPVQSEDTAFEVHATKDKKLIYFVDGDRWILINMETGEVFNAMIDGGRYDE